MTQTTVIFHMPDTAPDTVESFDSEVAAIACLAASESPWAHYVGITVCMGDSTGPVLWLWESDHVDSTLGANDYASALAASWRGALEFGAMLALNLDADQAESESLADYWANHGDTESPELVAMVKAVLRHAPEFSGEPNPDIPGDENRLARQFARELESALADTYGAESVSDIFAAINRENDSGKYPGACATHGFLDANMVMELAFVRVTGRASDRASESDSDWINRAWDSAKRAHFWKGADLQTPYGQIAARGAWRAFIQIPRGQVFAAHGGTWVKIGDSHAAGIWPACLPDKHKFGATQMVAIPEKES